MNCLYDSFSCRGTWFLPNEKSAKVGILTYSQSDGIVLEILEPCKKAINFDTQKEIPWIVGSSREHSHITLIGCLCIGHDFSTNTSLRTTVYRCKGIIVGGGRYFDIDLNTPAFDEIVITSPHLTEWMAAVRELFQMLNKDDFMCCSQIVEQFYLSDEIKVEFRKCYEKFANSMRFNVTPHVKLAIMSSKKISLNQMYYYVERFADFLTLSCLSCPSIELINLNLHDDSGNCDTACYYPDRSPYAYKVKDIPLPLFRYVRLAEYGVSFPQLLQRWFNIDRDVEPIREHLINSVNLRSRISTIDFQILAYALEGFSKRFRNIKDGTLGNRINALCQEFGDIQCVSQAQINPKAIADTRNYYSHFYFRKPQDIIYEGKELVDQTLSLRKLLICCILSLIGFTHEAINAMMGNDIDIIITRNKMIH